MRIVITAAATAFLAAGCQSLAMGGQGEPERRVEIEREIIIEHGLRGDDALPVDTTALHDRVLTMDTHIDIDPGYASYRLDPGVFNRAQVDLPSMRAGGLDAGFFIVYVGWAMTRPPRSPTTSMTRSCA
jgi:membrane dipeptidase